MLDKLSLLGKLSRRHEVHDKEIGFVDMVESTFMINVTEDDQLAAVMQERARQYASRQQAATSSRQQI